MGAAADPLAQTEIQHFARNRQLMLMSMLIVKIKSKNLSMNVKHRCQVAIVCIFHEKSTRISLTGIQYI